MQCQYSRRIVNYAIPLEVEPSMNRLSSRQLTIPVLGGGKRYRLSGPTDARLRLPQRAVLEGRRQRPRIVSVLLSRTRRCLVVNW